MGRGIAGLVLKSKHPLLSDYGCSAVKCCQRRLRSAPGNGTPVPPGWVVGKILKRLCFYWKTTDLRLASGGANQSPSVGVAPFEVQHLSTSRYFTNQFLEVFFAPVFSRAFRLRNCSKAS
jgi:hypothetical protein